MIKKNYFMFFWLLQLIVLAGAKAGVPQDTLYHFKSNGNPLVTHKYTADPATLVSGDTLWLYTGHDLPENKEVIR